MPGKRGARIYAEVVGYGCSSDAFHITSPAEDGSGAAKAMECAVQDAGAALTDITYINAHGTSTHLNDLFETRAIKLAFGEQASRIRINSTKSMVGHLLGAAGAVEFITCVKELQEGFIHATVGYQIPDEECDLNYCKSLWRKNLPMRLPTPWALGGTREPSGEKIRGVGGKPYAAFNKTNYGNHPPQTAFFCFWIPLRSWSRACARWEKNA